MNRVMNLNSKYSYLKGFNLLSFFNLVILCFLYVLNISGLQGVVMDIFTIFIAQFLIGIPMNMLEEDLLKDNENINEKQKIKKILKERKIAYKSLSKGKSRLEWKTFLLLSFQLILFVLTVANTIVVLLNVENINLKTIGLSVMGVISLYTIKSIVKIFFVFNKLCKTLYEIKKNITNEDMENKKGDLLNYIILEKNEVIKKSNNLKEIQKLIKKGYKYNEESLIKELNKECC